MPVTDEEWARLLGMVGRSLADGPATVGSDVVDGTTDVLVPELRSAIDRHRIATVLARDTAGLSERDRAWLRARTELNLRRAVAASARAYEVTQTLGAAGVRSVVLKGTPLAVVTTGSLDGRSCGDIDLLVDPARYVEAHRLLVADGWLLASGPAVDPSSPAFPWTRWIDNHATYHRRDPREPAGHLELHWRLGRSTMLRLDFESIWSEHELLDVGGVPLPTPGRDHHHLFVLAHALRHNTERLQWAVDVALLERGVDAATSQRLDRVARRYLPERTRVVARAVVQRIGLLQTEDQRLSPLERRLVRASLESLRTGSTSWSRTTGTLAVTGSPAALLRSLAGTSTYAVERLGHRLPTRVDRLVRRRPDHGPASGPTG